MDGAKKIVDVVAFKEIGISAKDLDPMGYADDALGTEIGDLTAELLADVLQLVHPDKHRLTAA